MSESNPGTSAMDTGGAAVLKQPDATDQNKDNSHNTITKLPNSTKNNSLSPSKGAVETNKSPVKKGDDKKPDADVNGDETEKTPDKTEQKQAEDESTQGTDATLNVAGAAEASVEKITPKETDTQKEKPTETDRQEEEMEVAAAGTEVAVDSTPQRRKRSSTTEAPPKTPSTPWESPRSKRMRSPSSAAGATLSEGRTKRQRRQVEKFQAATPTQEPATPTSPTTVKLYDKNTTLAVRADGASFYLCRCMNPVLNTNKRFKIRWYEIEQAPDLYRLAYEDRVELECVIGPAHLQRTKSGLLQLTGPELTRIEQLIKAAENGEDVTKLDPELFKPQTTVVKTPAKEVIEVNPQDADTDVEPDAEDEPAPKRPRRGASREATPKVAEKTKPARKPRTPKAPKSPKAPTKTAKTPKTPKAAAAGKKVARGKRKMNKVVSIETAAPPLRKTATLQLGGLQRKMSLIRRPSALIRLSSLQRWPSMKVKPKRAKLEPGAPKPPKKPVDPNKKLRHNPRVTVWEKDPLFESRLEVPFVSTMMHSRLAIRAVNLKDAELLNSVIADTKQISTVNVQRSCHSDKDTMTYALLSEQKDIIKLLHDESKTYRSRASDPPNLLGHMGTGRYNPRTLPGVKAVRKLKVSRGGKEGNNALSKDRARQYTPSTSESIQKALEGDISFETLKHLMDFSMIDRDNVYNSIVHAVRFGHRKLASRIMEEAAKAEMYGFNFMHRESLKFDNGEDFTGKMLEASVLKNPYENRNMRPIHCAAINPNTKYLSKMLSICSSWNVEDSDKRRPIHYAAACTGTGPLKLLIDKHVSLDEADEKGYTPLIMACITGRAENVKVILDKLVQNEADTEMDEVSAKKKLLKFGRGGVNRPMKNSWCPIHFAVANNRKDVIQVLLDNGADVNRNVNASFNRITPLIMAAQEGDLDLVRFLIQHGAKIEKPDKLKRTALVHAVRDGNANVASYLLNRGADPNVADSSGNTALHYAVAYGWYFCMKVLLDAGANPDPANDWKLTPLGASFLKGNLGLTKILMDLPGVNIDFQDDEGKTLLHHTLARYPYTQKTVDDVKLLVVQKKANVKLLDKAKNNVIHYLFRQSLPTESSWRYNRIDNDHRGWEEARKDILAAMREIVDLLIEHGCDPWQKTGVQNIFYLTFQNGEGSRPIEILNHVMDKHPWIEDNPRAEETGHTLLYELTSTLGDTEKFEMLYQLCKVEVDGRSGLQEFRKMAKVRFPNDGETAFIKCCKSYAQNCYASYSEATDEYNKRMTTYRDRIKFLIDDLQSELEYVWEKKEKKYHISVLRHLLSAHVQEDYKAFDMIMTYKPNVDFKYENGHTMLLENVTYGNYRESMKLLDAGADINQKLEDKTKARMTPLLICLQQNRANLLPQLLERGADRNAIKEDTKETGIHIAINHCSDVLGVITQLINKDSNINVQDKNLRTPLHLVINRSTDSQDESKKLEHLILKNGADPFIKDIRGRMPIHYLFVKIGTHTRSNAIDPVESYSILCIAMKNQKLDEPDEFGQTPLHRAAYRGATVCAMLLIQRGCNVNAKDKDGNTPLSFAVWRSHDSCALTLIQKGADINGDVITNPTADIHPKILAKRREAEESKQNGPVSNSVENHMDLSSSDDSDRSSDDDTDDSDHIPRSHLNDVIKKNIDKIEVKPVWKYASRHYPRPWKPGKRGYPIFQGLVMNGWQGLTFLAMDLLEPFGMQYASVVEIALTLGKFTFALNLMEKQLDNEKLRVKNEHGQTLLHVLAKVTSGSGSGLQERIMEDLVRERGVDVNNQDKDGFTALHHCILQRNWDRAFQLVDGYKLDLDLQDKFGRTPLATLIWFGTNHLLLKRLLSKGAKTDILVDFPPMSVQQKGYLPQVDETDYHRPYDNKRLSPLNVAIIRRWHKDVQNLLKKASPSFPDSEGITPLMYAVQTGDILLVLLLLDSNINIENFNKEEAKVLEDIRSNVIAEPVVTDDDLFAGIRSSTAKTSSVDVNAVDHQGRTAVHHLLTTLPYATREHLRILKTLADAKASLDTKDKDGKTPLDLALERGALMMSKGIQSLLGVTKSEWRPLSYDPFTVADDLTWDGPAIDYVADAQAMVKVMEEEEAELIAQMPRAVPDKRLQIENAEVMMDEEIDMPYDILMTKVDVKVGEYGLYNFYKMQVVCDPKKDLYLLFNCWGRIGDEGQYQRTPFKSDKEAKDEFAKIFKAKSGNEWKEIKSFEVKPKRYRLVDADYRRQNTNVSVKYDLTSCKIPSKLPPYIRDLMAEMSNVSMLRTAMRKTGIDIPFGRLKRENLIKAREMLIELHDLASKMSEFEGNLTTENIDEYRLVCEQVAELSSEYYYLVPDSGYEYEALLPLKDTYSVEKKIQSLSQLLELEYTGTLLLGAQHRIKDMNPYDYLYRAMKIHLQQLPESSPEAQTILQYAFIDTTSKDIEAVYRMEREGEPERMKSCKVTDNHKLLWHGSRTSNLLSILSRGMLIAPKDVPITGMAFGKGIYTADYFGKSEGYCHNDGGGKSRYMLLCEVAVGKEHHMDSNSNLPEVLPPENSDSVQANGHQVPDPVYDAMLPTGMKIPLGSLATNYAPYSDERHGWHHWHRSRSVNYNEFIVYSEDQVCLRYLVQFR